MAVQSVPDHDDAPRVPPFDLEAERALLGSMLLSRSAIDTVRYQVVADDFYRSLHGHLFTAIVEAWKHGAVDTVTVADHLRGVELPGDASQFLRQLQAEAPAAVNANAYAKIVVDAATLRALIGAAGRIAEAAYENPPEIADVLTLAHDLVSDAEARPLNRAPDLDLDQFTAGDCGYEWLVRGLLERMDRLLIVAAEGFGKTTLIRQLAVQFSQGLHPFRTDLIEPLRVLLIDCENPVTLARRKLRALRDLAAKELGSDYNPEPFRVIMRPEGIDVTRRSDALWLRERVAANNPDVLFIGPIYKLHEAEDEKSSDVRQVQKVLDHVRTFQDCAVVMETHAPHESFRKGGQLRPAGSRLWLRWPEFVMTLEPDASDDKLAKVRYAKGPRDERDWPTTLVRSGRVWPWETPGLL